MNWPNPWKEVPDSHRMYIERELAWEVSQLPDHPLSSRPFRVIAMADVYNHAIIQIDRGNFGYIRLTWKQQSPYFEVIGAETELLKFVTDSTESYGRFCKRDAVERRGE